MATIADAQALALRSGWIEAPAVGALYVSAGSDTKPFPLLHPEFLARQGAAGVVAPSFLICVDQNLPGPNQHPALTFRDERTRIETVAHRKLRVGGVEASLLRVSLTSDVLSDRDVAVLRLRMANEDFAKVALAQGWRPEWFIGVCDGCGAFGRNSRCENALLNSSASIPLRLGARWWVTDHLPGGDAPTTRPGGATDLVNGQVVVPSDPRSDLRLRQVAFISTDWRSNVADSIRLYGGARVFEVERVAQQKAPDAFCAPLRPLEHREAA